MANMVIYDFEPPKYAGPPWWARAIVYTFFWWPFFWVLVVHVPRFEPIFAKLAAKGKLPVMTSCLRAFVRLNASCLYLPLLLMVLLSATVDEFAVTRLRHWPKGSLWSWLWVVAMALAVFPAMVLLVHVLLAPVYVLTSEVP